MWAAVFTLSVLVLLTAVFPIALVKFKMVFRHLWNFRGLLAEKQVIYKQIHFCLTCCPALGDLIFTSTIYFSDFVPKKFKLGKVWFLLWGKSLRSPYCEPIQQQLLVIRPGGQWPALLLTKTFCSSVQRQLGEGSGSWREGAGYSMGTHHPTKH